MRRTIYGVICAATASTLLSPTQSFACSILSAQQYSQHHVGKSYDWDFEQGLITVNKRNVRKEALLLDRTSVPATWTSRFGSVTFNQYGREFPLGGMNEAGLVIEIAWLDETIYPKADSRPTVNELQWVQFQLDQYGTTKDLVAHLDDIRIAPAYANVHYMVCDAAKDCVTVEYLNGKLVTHTGTKLDITVLTNDNYALHRKALRKFKGFGGWRALPTGSGSFARYARAAAFTGLPRDTRGLDARTEVFSVLDAVNQGDFSKWHIAYNTSEGTISWRTLSAKSIKVINTHDFDYSCTTPVKLHDVISSAVGDVTDSFDDYTGEANLRLLSTTMKDLAAVLPPGTMELVAKYPESTSCLD